MSTLESLGITRQGGSPVVAYLKPSDFCAIGCEHCYLPVEVRANKSRMSDETLRAATQTVKDMIARQRAPGAAIIWHGGEPLSLPQPYFADCCEFVRSEIPDAQQSIQTSLIPYRTSWAPMIHKYFEGGIGSSVDFSQRVIRGSSEAYLELWLTKVEMARADGCHIIPGTVPSKGELGRGGQIVSWMKDNDFSEWNIDRYNSFGHEDPMRPSNKEHSLFLTEVFDGVMALAQEGVFMKVNTVVAALLGILSNQPGDRWGGSCSRDFIVVNPDGSTSACPDKISFENVSNVNEGGFDGFEKSQQRRDWIRLHLAGHRNDDCPTCPYRTFCRSGCPLTPNAPESEGECSGYHRHLRHVQNFVQRNETLIQSYMKRVLA
jgi:uncharacterized protein